MKSDNDLDIHIQDGCTQRVIVSVQRKDVLPDLLVFPGTWEGESLMKTRVSKWMRKGTLAEDG